MCVYKEELALWAFHLEARAHHGTLRCLAPLGFHVLKIFVAKWKVHACNPSMGMLQLRGWSGEVVGVEWIVVKAVAVVSTK